MAWVRYDDGFSDNPKVTAVIADNPAALALHVLANTWSNKQRHPGFVPAHQPAILLCDRKLGVEWAQVLVRHGLWHERGAECPSCVDEYADLPDGLRGFVFHNARDYRPAARDRVTPGTPAELSEKRREAGRKGGAKAAERRKSAGPVANQANQANQANGAAAAGARVPRGRSGGHDADQDLLWADLPDARPAKTSISCQANGVSKSSNLPLAGVSPVPVPEPINTSTADAVEAAGSEVMLFGASDLVVARKTPSPRDIAFGLARWWIERRRSEGTPVITPHKSGPLHPVRTLIEGFAEHYSEDEIRAALERIDKGFPSKSELDTALARARRGQSNYQGRADGYLGRRDGQRMPVAERRLMEGAALAARLRERAENGGNR